MLRLSNNLSHQDGSVSSHRLPEGSFDYLVTVATSLDSERCFLLSVPRRSV